MSVGLNAAQARAKALQDMIVHETQEIMKAIILVLVIFEAYVDDATTMTEAFSVQIKLH